MSQTQETPNTDEIKEEWISRLIELISNVKAWAEELDWSCREIEKKMEDSILGKYVAPALILQHETYRVLLDPIARSAPGADGVVDLYLMPAFDDIASLYLNEDGWHLHYMFPEDKTVGNIREAESKLLCKDTLADVLEEVKQNVV